MIENKFDIFLNWIRIIEWNLKEMNVIELKFEEMKQKTLVKSWEMSKIQLI